MSTKSATSGLLIKTALILVAVGGATGASIASAQVVATNQTVDQVEVFSLNKVLRLKYDPDRFVGLAAAPTSTIRACQSSNVNGLFCLDGQVFKNWRTVAEHSIVPPGAFTPAPGTALFSCLDTALGLALGNPCTAMTVDESGDVWLAGLKSDGSGTYRVIEVTPKIPAVPTDVCPAGFDPLAQSANYCFDVRAEGRPLIRDLSPVEGDLVTGYFTEGEGVLGVEGGAAVFFYPNDPSELPRQIDIAAPAGSSIQSATILQRRNGTGAIHTYALITTNLGEVWARNLTTNSAAAQYVHANLDGGDLPRGTACSGGLIANQFRVRASETSGRIFVTNRNYCDTFVIAPTYLNDELSGISESFAVPTDAGSPTYPPDGLAVSPGVAINTATCTGNTALLGCDFFGDGDGNGYPAVTMYGVIVGNPAATGMRVFKVENIPDCRYLFPTNGSEEPPPGHPCDDPDVIVIDTDITDGSQNLPQRQYLNITPMLPETVTDLFDDSGLKPLGLPKILISPRYRAQKDNGYIFEGLFGVADPDIQFRKTFTVVFDIGDFNLAGSNLGCGVHHPDGQPGLAQPFNRWDIVTMVSERFSSVGGPTGRVKDTIDGVAEHVDTMINKDCFNPTPTAGTRWSMYSYNMELAEDKPVKSGKTGPTTGFAYSRAVGYLGNLLLALHTDLGTTQTELACKNVDEKGNSGDLGDAIPLNLATCATLNTKWKTAQAAIVKCATAANDTGTSGPSKNCETFIKAVLDYESSLDPLPMPVLGIDPANRIGELMSRTDVIKYVYYKHFINAWKLGPGIANAQ